MTSGKARRERTTVISSFVLILLARDSFGRCDPRVPLRILPHHFSTQFRSENIRPREATMRTSRHIQPMYRCRYCSSASQPVRRLKRTLVFVPTVKLEVMSTKAARDADLQVLTRLIDTACLNTINCDLRYAREVFSCSHKAPTQQRRTNSNSIWSHSLDRPHSACQHPIQSA